MVRSDAGEGAPALLALSCVGFLVSAPALAQTPPPPPEKNAVELKGVTVTDSAIDDTGYKAERADSPKAVAPLLDTPRSIVVIGEQVIKETGSATLVDALRTVPGITFGAAEGGNPIGDRPFIRGFDSQGSTYVDGIRSIGAQTREVFAVSQIQVVRGSDSTLGGRGSAGGSINIISKLPEADSFYRADASYGTADYKRVTGDINYVLTPTIAMRMAAMWHDQDVAGRDALFQKRWGVAPSLTIGIGTPTRLTASYYHLHTDELPDSGLPYTTVCTATICNAPAGYSYSEPVNRVLTLGGVRGKVDRSTFYGLKDRDFRKSNTDEFMLRAEHDFGRGVTLRNTARFNHTYQGYIFLLPDDSTGNVVGTSTTNTTTAGVTNFINGGYVWRRANTRRGSVDSFIDQVDLTAKFRTGALRHSLATGLEFSLEDAHRGTYLLATGSTISPRCNTNTVARYYCTSLFAPNPNDPYVNYTNDTSNVATAITNSPGYADTINHANTKAAYIFDSIEIGEALIINLGLRFDHFETSIAPGLANATTARFRFSRNDDLVNYQGGVIFKPTKNTSLYATYATSATPPNSLIGEGQELNALPTTVTAATLATLDQLKVEKSKTAEVGAKAELFDGQLALNVALFRTETKNARVTIDANTVAFVGERRAQGFEIGFNGKILPQWSVFGGYSYLDAEIRDGGFSALTAAAVGAQAAKVVYVPSVNTGRQFPQTAKNTFTIWTNYNLFKGISVGGGAFYNSRVFGGYSDNRRAVQNTAGVVTVVPATSIIARSVPSYWRFDARIGAKITDALNLSVNIQNLTDKRYYNQAYSNHYASIAPGRSAFATLSLAY